LNILLLAAALTSSVPPPEPVASFRSAGAAFTLKLPAGYCVPADEFIDVAQALASIDADNVTVFTAFQCDANGLRAAHPLLIKTPKTALLTRLDRAQLTEALKVEFNKADFSALLDLPKITADTNQAFNDVLKSDAKLELLVKPLGQDVVCNYLGGTVTLDGDVSAMAACMTVVAQRVLTIYMYSDYAGPASVAALVGQTRAVADALIARNEAQ
jgi:hypothetical protein